jgi:hypothetical protein
VSFVTTYNVNKLQAELTTAIFSFIAQRESSLGLSGWRFWVEVVKDLSAWQPWGCKQ